jgi:hypothetical protein
MDTDIGDMKLYARIVQKDNNGKLHLVHNHDHERVLIAHEHECTACAEYKPCPKSSYHSISVAAEHSELIMYLQASHYADPDEATTDLYHLLISTADRSAFILSAPFKIVKEVNLSNSRMFFT